MSLFPKPNTLIFLFIFFLASILTGCGRTVAPAAPSPVLGPVAAFLATAELGQSTTLDDPEFGSNVRVTVEDVFVSAKGEPCRRGTVLSSHGSAEVIAICLNKRGEWEMAPRVWGQSLQ